MPSYLLYICQAVRNRAGLERYWQFALATYPRNVNALAGYGPCEVLDADQGSHLSVNASRDSRMIDLAVADLGGTRSSGRSDGV